MMHSANRLVSQCTATLITLVLGCGVGHAQTQRVFRCEIDGQVSFQQRACPSNSVGKVLDVRQGNTIEAPQRPRAAAVNAETASPPLPPLAKSALEAEAEACLEHLRPFLRDPRSAYVSGPSRDGRVLSLTVHAANSRGAMARRKAACEVFNGSIDVGWTKIHLQRLGWFQPRAVIVDKHPRHRRHLSESLDDIEVPAS